MEHDSSGPRVKRKIVFMKDIGREHQVQSAFFRREALKDIESETEQVSDNTPLLSKQSDDQYKQSFGHKIFKFLDELPIVHGDTPARLNWVVVVYVAIMWNAITIPMRLAFRDLWERNDILAFYVVDYFMDLIYILDMLVHLRTSFMEKGTSNDCLRFLSRQIFIFSKISQDCLQEILQSFEIRSMESREMVYNRGDDCNDMYFLCKGRLEVLDKDDNVIRVLDPGTSIEEGCVIGHVDIVLRRKMNVSIRVAHKCIINVLSWKQLERISIKYKDDWDLMKIAATSHSDRYCAIFGRESAFKRPGKLLWSIAMKRIKMVNTFKKSIKTKYNREWLDRLKALHHEDIDWSSISNDDLSRIAHLIHICEGNVINQLLSTSSSLSTKSE